VARFVLLDAGPIGLACSRPGTPAVDQCRGWLVHLETSAVIVVIPALTDYEVRRELVRMRATAKLRRLDTLRIRFGCLGLSPAAFDLAAELWASVRRAGFPKAADEALDADAILAGLATTVGGLGDTVTIATGNVRHFSRFPGVRAELWSTIH
jgi:toxin FitB